MIGQARPQPFSRPLVLAAAALRPIACCVVIVQNLHGLCSILCKMRTES
jgi:hypothetical protein